MIYFYWCACVCIYVNVYSVCVQVPTETKEGYKWKNSREEARKLATLWKINGYCYMLPPCGMVCYQAPSADLESQVQGGRWEVRYSWWKCTSDSCLALLTEDEHRCMVARTEKVHIGIKHQKEYLLRHWIASSGNHPSIYQQLHG